MMSVNYLTKIFIRKEIYPNEYRTPLVPDDITNLLNCGFSHVYIESSDNRIFTDEEYNKNGGLIVKDEWYHPKYQDCLIIGIKQLPFIDKLNSHTHIYFSHSYKNQFNSEYILYNFKRSDSLLYDLEYFRDNNKQRIISFGYYAGIVGSALGLMNYLGDLKNQLRPWINITSLFLDITKTYPDNLKIAITTGKNGKTGLGVKYILDSLNLKYTLFDRESDKSKLIDCDLIYNCINLTEEIDPWFTEDNIKLIDNKITIVDISCDYDNRWNPIRIYNRKTTWEEPVLKRDRIDIIAIDNLPSLLPTESSLYFSNKLKELLSDYRSDNEKYWIENKNIYNRIISTKISKY